MLFFAAGAFGIINPEEKELCFSGMLHWQEIVGECVCASVRGGRALVGSSGEPAEAAEG